MTLKQNIKIWISVSIITLSVLTAELIGNYEIIFPEIAALASGALVAEKQPWEVSRIKMLVLMSVSAFAGYGLSAFVNIPLFFKVIIGFLFCAVMLLCTRCTIFPMISACILPVLMHTESLYYPVSVIIMTAIIVLVQWLFEKYKLSIPRKHKPVIYEKKTEALRWIFLFAALAAFAAVATGFNITFIIAPPLIVTLCEFSYTDSKARKKPLIIFFMISLFACMGACVRMVMCQILHLPITLAIFIVTVAIIYISVLMKVIFPPACAVALLPFIIDSKAVFIYPLEIILGSALFITLSMLFGKYIEKRSTTV
ncbi:MAG: hypothetical protein ACI4GV_04225 [Acutalibacteraceae bacterium]